jgi:hypothetical protein
MRRAVRIFLAVFLFSRAAAPVFSRAEAEAGAVPINGEWVFCITAFDASALPPARRALGELLARNMYEALLDVDRRIRTAGEGSYYREYARSRAVADAAKALAAKRGQRDMLIYQGNPGWKYKKNLKAVDGEIAELEEALRQAEAGEPFVEEKPLYKFTDANKNGTWPDPPRQGGEYRFCNSQKADAFLTGTLSEYHGRLYLSLKMYTLHSRSWSWEDSAVFSPGDLIPAVREIAERLAAEAAGSTPGVSIVRAEPENSMVIINGAYAGTGEAVYSDFSPGGAEVAVYADKHQSRIFPVEVNPGEIAELYINLAPLGLSAFTVEVPGSPGSAVYSGGLYLGTAPLEVEIPSGRFTYLSVVTPEGETGSAVYRGGGVIRGSAEFVRSPQGGRALTYETSLPVPPEEKRVNTARGKFYGAYGRFWFALPAALLAVGMAENYLNAYSYNLSYEMYEKGTTAYNVSIGAYVLIGLAAADTVYRIIRYLYTSGSDAAPLARFPETPGLQGETTR